MGLDWFSKQLLCLGYHEAGLGEVGGQVHNKGRLGIINMDWILGDWTYLNWVQQDIEKLNWALITSKIFLFLAVHN